VYEWWKGDNRRSYQTKWRRNPPSFRGDEESYRRCRAGKAYRYVCVALYLRKCSNFVSDTTIFYVAKLSPPPEPYDPKADPALKGTLDVIRIANEAVDEAVNRLLNEAAEKILKEDE
jgi:hypothetical protein